MSRVSVLFRIALVAVAVAVGLSACGKSPTPYFVATHEDWRDDRERACLKSRQVRETAHITRMSRLNGPSLCGARAPYQVTALGDGAVAMSVPATLRCSMVPALESWIHSSVQPQAYAAFGEPVVEMTVAASYSCRPRNNSRGAKLSEHGYANAFDVSAFTLASGRTVAVETGWRGRRDEQVFLRGVHRGACQTFSTVLGPDGDRAHYNHFHFDLARHGRDGDYRVCK